MTREATLWLIDQGIKVMGIDAITFDPPVWAMFERKQFWEAHLCPCGSARYYHIENVTNLDPDPPSLPASRSLPFRSSGWGRPLHQCAPVAIVEE